MPDETPEQKAEREKREQEEREKASHTDDRDKAIIDLRSTNEQLLAALNKTNERLALLEDESKKSKEKPPEKVDEKNKRFWDNPTAVLQEALDETVKPLREFVTEVKSGTAYDKLRARYAQDPRFKSLFDNAKVAGMIDELMSKNSPTDGAMKAVIFGVRGAIELGEIPGITLETKETDEQKKARESKEEDERKRASRGKEDMTIPPHLRPSSAPGPTREKEDARVAKYKEMADNADENQRRLARENRMTLEQYFESLDVPALSVVSSDVMGARKKIDGVEVKEEAKK